MHGKGGSKTAPLLSEEAAAVGEGWRGDAEEGGKRGGDVVDADGFGAGSKPRRHRRKEVSALWCELEN